jgi:L-serine/L-threonine ammonia-lyase
MFDDLLPPKPDGKRRTVVFIVCGGSKISLEDMGKYRAIVALETSSWNVWVEGRAIKLEK